NLATDAEYKVSSTCRAIGKHSYIFVEDAIWNQRINQNSVNSIKEAFDNSTPANPNKGIYEIDVETFGDPPDVDTDSLIIILILDIKDGFTGSGGYVAGYFYSANEYPDGNPALGGIRSNFTEIYYIDADPADLNTVSGLQDGMATTAHEFQHMIHWRWDDDEVTFVNEGCSMIAEFICGYNLEYWFNLYQTNTNRYLFYWDYDDPFPDYARSALWTVYLYEQFPNNFLKELVANKYIGLVGIDSTLKNHILNMQAPLERNFITIFEDWLIANYANDNSLDRKYYYTYSPISKPIPIYTHFGSSDLPATTETVNYLSAHYIKFSDGNNLSMVFNSTSESIRIKAIKIGSTVIEDVPINTVYTPAEYGTTFSEVTFIVYNTSPSQKATYVYSAVGPEISYDDGIPEGYLQLLSPGDSIAVHFNGMPNSKLDSIRIAFRRSGTIKMGIWTFTGSYETTPFGGILYEPQDIISTDSTTSFPYPIPFDNWVTVDLTGQNIDTNADFIISFLIGSNPNAPAIMYSSEPDQGRGNRRSYIYTNVNKTNRWNYIIDNDIRGNNKNILVRVYKSISSATVSIDQDRNAENTTNFSLEQNYPNPFNPLTTIQYRLANDSEVTLVIYDLVGNKIITLINEYKPSGQYSVLWNGKDYLGQAVSSGIYLYTLQVGNYIQTKKMVYLK
ncbi:MAG: T9SS type A sorting domain-containing protein, partial [Planctomycetia bacterium]|nr:T9SS type A sorting domain-containing protein [Planctomycetia bacterium]